VGRLAKAAAGVFLDALAQYRRALRLSAIAVAWGRWEASGRPEQPAADLAGVGVLTTQQGLDMLDTAQTVGDAVLLALRPDPNMLRRGRVPELMSALIDGPSWFFAPDTAVSSVLAGRLVDLSEAE